MRTAQWGCGAGFTTLPGGDECGEDIGRVGPGGHGWGAECGWVGQLFCRVAREGVSKVALGQGTEWSGE